MSGTISKAQVFDQLRAFIERWSPTPATYNFGRLVDEYIHRHGMVPVESVPKFSVRRLLVEFRAADGDGCPGWCELERGHKYQDEPGTGRQVREHTGEFGNYVGFTLIEYADEHLFTQPTHLLVTVPTVACDAARGRQLAAELLNAADELDTITGNRMGDRS